METWRVLGAVAAGCGGLLLIIISMAHAREHAVREKRSRFADTAARVSRTGLIGLAALAVGLLLMLTVLPQFMVWTTAAAVWLILVALIFVG